MCIFKFAGNLNSQKSDWGCGREKYKNENFCCIILSLYYQSYYMLLNHFGPR